MKRVVAYVSDETHSRLETLKTIERRSMSSIAGALIDAQLAGDDEFWKDRRVTLDRPTGVVGDRAGVDSPGSASGRSGGAPSLSSRREPGPVQRALERREKT